MENTNNKLRVVFGDTTLGIHGGNFHYIFSYTKGGLESLVKDGLEWLYRTPVPTFWRALTDNDRGNQFHLKSGMWIAADTFIKCCKIEIIKDGENMGQPLAPVNNQLSSEVYADVMKVVFTYATLTVPSTTVDISYEINAEGKILMDVCYHGKEGLPQLPVFGVRFIMPTKAAGYQYEGLSGETYPDRMAGGIKGVYEVEGIPMTPYMVPQDCGMHMQTEWAEITRNTCLDNRRNNACKDGRAHALKFVSNEETFAFSCLPYTAEEIENATHHEELPPARRTVMCVYGAVRGVGGIDSWGADVEEKYHISGEKDIHFSFFIV